ncbi:glycoside hydrolase family 6 protein [Planosporangium mesophilum]|uniref:Glucanase n=1 Tax=Planosporangium mesophilum TaxID=689768 RepID=A0A8J3WZA5_9ACTN|nr:glycoside hydrolase family 6 protein [Planosporangium mesophilum]NJC85677.1 cellulose 1,4-beta-cellobiosidase [Planosporangium mesophilum]GII21426.1 glucanase [Planosporangium mesophilum]
MRLSFQPGARRSRTARGLAAAGALIAGVGMVTVAATRANAAAGCSVNYTVNQWNTGFTANVAITNLGDPLTSWTLEWDYSGNQQITSSWNSSYAQSGQHVTLKNAAYNGSLGTNATVTPGFQATYSGTNTAPASFKLNGTTCNGGTQPTPTSTRPTTAPPTTTPPTTTPPTTQPPTSPPPSGTHLDNPYVGAKPYVNPLWSQKAAAEPGGTKVSNQHTFVWLDRIAAVNGTGAYTMGLQAHLDAAVAQGANLVEVVVYDLPGRDCAALASNGELGPTDLPRYKSEYIDKIASIESQAKYAGLRIVHLIEPDSLPNLVTNAGGTAGSTDACATMKANGGYEQGVAYALGKLHAVGSNTYNYVDAGHHAWLGWDSNLNPSAQEFAKVAQMATGGYATVDGFVVNTANYSALHEPWIQPSVTINGQSIRQSKWIDWNQYSDEATFAVGLKNALVSAGFPARIGMLVDTSRNGWGGANRPTKASTSTDVNTYVDQSRIDRRIHAGNWCNQSGAGIGERPKANPESGIAAYVWVKPPGESDGASQQIPNDQGKGFDRMCDPTYTGNARNGNNPTGALPNSPLAGDWFSAQFQQLVQNAYPPLQ